MFFSILTGRAVYRPVITRDIWCALVHAVEDFVVVTDAVIRRLIVGRFYIEPSDRRSSSTGVSLPALFLERVALLL